VRTLQDTTLADLLAPSGVLAASVARVRSAPAASSSPISPASAPLPAFPA